MKLLDAEMIEQVVGGTWIDPASAQDMIDEFNRTHPQEPYVPAEPYWP